MVKRAACVLIPAGELSIDGQQSFLAVTRRSNIGMVGLPGGKVDPGESELDAAIRETAEETGLLLAAKDLVPLFVEYCPGKVGYWVTTFLFVGKIQGKPRKIEENIIPVYSVTNVLCDVQYSPFAKYNVGVFGAYNKYKEAHETLEA